jgi:hypothetical protein
MPFVRVYILLNATVFMNNLSKNHVRTLDPRFLYITIIPLSSDTKKESTLFMLNLLKTTYALWIYGFYI